MTIRGGGLLGPRRRLAWVSLALAALVGVLAVLQYRWLGQVSDAERDRLRASVQSSAERIAEAFDRELTHAYMAVQLEPETFDRRVWTTYAARLDQWRSAATFPRIIGDVLLAERASGGAVTLLRFDEKQRTFIPAAWPERAASVARWFNEGARWPHPIRPEVPALVQAVPDLQIIRDDLKLNAITNGSVRACIVALIDMDVVTGEVLPALVRTYAGASGAVDYDVEVRDRREPGRLIFATNPARAVSGAADTAEGLFDLRLNLLTERPQLQWHGETGERRFMISIVQRGTAAGNKPPLPGLGPFWELTLRHKSGSLETVVASARRRNLLLSSSILALLATSIGLVLLSARRAERLAAQQVEFVAAVSHELRTPLAVIRSAGENLADGVVAEPAQVQRYGTLVRDEGQRLTDLVEQVLAYAGIGSTRAGVDARRPCDLTEIVAAATAAVREVIDCSGVTIDVDVPSTLPRVLADRAAVGRALVNLLTNAVKYGGDGKWVGVTARLVGKEIAVSVADRGIGIAAADLPHVFSPFYRAGSVVAAQIRGTGLGLAVVEGIARAHGGRVTVASAPGEGSTFTLHLPAVTADAAPQWADASSSSKTSPASS